MMSQIVAFGDTHLRAADPWNADRLSAWDQVIAHGSSLKQLGAWVHCGDVFDGASSIQDRNDAAERLQRMLEKAPVLIVGGNHERPGDLAIYRRLSGRHSITVVESASVVAVPLATKHGAVVFALPYPSKGALVAAGLGAQEADQALDTLFVDAAQRLREEQARGAVAFMVGHATITGSRASTGQPLIGPEISVTAAHLSRLPKEILKVFGHIHLPQALHGAAYVGSGCRLSFGETEAKRFIVATIREDSIYQLESVPLVCPSKYHAECEIDREAVRWRLTKGPDGPVDAPPADADWAGCDIRARVRYVPAERALLGDIRTRVQSEFPGARRVDVEPIAVQQRELRAPEVVQATTLSEKLRAWARLTGTPWAAEMERCAERLLSTDDGEAIIGSAAARLNAAEIAEVA